VRAYTTFSGVTLKASYSTGPADTAPTVVSVSPASGATNIAANASLGLSFSEAVTLSSGWFTLNCSATGSHAATVSGGPTAFTLNPNVDFGSLETCTLTVLASKVLDQDGSPTPMAANFASSFTTSAAPTGYYAGVNTGSASALRSSLHPIIDDHVKIPYTASSTDTWDALNVVDQDPLNTSRVLDIYKNASYVKASGGNNFYNREHTWPNSLGFPSDGATNYAYTDLHMLMISDIAYNSSRGNKPYDNCPSGCTEYATTAYNGAGGGSGTYPGNSNWSNASVFQVWSRLKGNVARAMFYMDLRYEGGTHGGSGAAEPDLRLTDTLSLVTTTGSNASIAYMGKLSTLIQWHQQDPVDAAEQLRNEVIQTYQGNRNPFIDHPEWVGCIYQSICN
jgi:endonuclease I